MIQRRRIEPLDSLIGKGRLYTGSDPGARVDYRIDRTRKVLVMPGPSGSSQHPEQERWTGYAQVIDGAIPWGGDGCMLELENGDKWPVTIEDGDDRRVVLSARDQVIPAGAT